VTEWKSEGVRRAGDEESVELVLVLLVLLLLLLSLIPTILLVPVRCDRDCMSV
jgi:hypothetical protein